MTTTPPHTVVPTDEGRRDDRPEHRDGPEEAGHAVYRAVQEAMTNAVRHAGARAINVQCRVAPPSAEIVVSDDGRGLGAGRHDSHGLEIMSERAALIGAHLDVSPSVPHGTTVAVRLSGHGVSMPEPVSANESAT